MDVADLLSENANHSPPRSRQDAVAERPAVFHLAESFGLAGETERALDLLDQAVDQGFYPYPFMTEHCPFLAPLRPLPRFAAILGRARERAAAFRDSGDSSRPPARPSGSGDAVRVARQ